MSAIKRLQDVYNLKAQDFTRGKYGLATESGSMITAMDAFKIGRGAFLSEDMENTRQWMGESLQILDLEPNNSKEKPSRFSVLDHLAWSSYKVSMSTSIRRVLNDVTKIKGGGPRAPQDPPSSLSHLAMPLALIYQPANLLVTVFVLNFAFFAIVEKLRN